MDGLIITAIRPIGAVMIHIGAGVTILSGAIHGIMAGVMVARGDGADITVAIIMVSGMDIIMVGFMIIRTTTNLPPYMVIVGHGVQALLSPGRRGGRRAVVAKNQAIPPHVAIEPMAAHRPEQAKTGQYNKVRKGAIAIRPSDQQCQNGAYKAETTTRARQHNKRLAIIAKNISDRQAANNATSVQNHTHRRQVVSPIQATNMYVLAQVSVPLLLAKTRLPLHQTGKEHDLYPRLSG